MLYVVVAMLLGAALGLWVWDRLRGDRCSCGGRIRMAHEDHGYWSSEPTRHCDRCGKREGFL